MRKSMQLMHFPHYCVDKACGEKLPTNSFHVGSVADLRTENVYKQRKLLSDKLIGGKIKHRSIYKELEEKLSDIAHNLKLCTPAPEYLKSLIQTKA